MSGSEPFAALSDLDQVTHLRAHGVQSDDVTVLLTRADRTREHHAAHQRGATHRHRSGLDPEPEPAGLGPAERARLAERAGDLAADVADLKDALGRAGVTGYDQDLSDAHLVLATIEDDPELSTKRQSDK